MKKVTSYLAGVLLILLLFTGCKQKIVITTGFEEGQLIKISGKIVDLSETMILLLGDKASYDKGLDENFWSIKYKDKTMLEYFKQEEKEAIIRINILSEFAKSKNVTLSDEDSEVVKKATEMYLENSDSQLLSNYGIEEKDVKSLIEKIILSEKVYEEIVSNYNAEISDEKARVMYVSYIYLDAKQEKAADIANEIYNKLLEGNDMKTVSESYDYASYAEEYITRADFSEEQSNIIFKLQDGQLSEILEENNRLYIIKCVKHYDETMSNANKLVLIEQEKTAEFEKEYAPFKNSIDIEFNTELWKELNFAGTENVIAPDIYDIIEKAEQQ